MVKVMMMRVWIRVQDSKKVKDQRRRQVATAEGITLKRENGDRDNGCLGRTGGAPNGVQDQGLRELSP